MEGRLWWGGQCPGDKWPVTRIHVLLGSPVSLGPKLVLGTQENQLVSTESMS